MHSQEDLLRFEWGICAVCGTEVEAHGRPYYARQSDGTLEVVTRERSMLCDRHQEDFRRSHCEFHRFVRTHPDSHLLFHEFEMTCPICLPCPVCEERLAEEGDYLCGVCRYGE